MKITNHEFDRGLGMYIMRCPLCGKILMSGSDADIMPEFAICDCDKVTEKTPVYELYECQGRTMIRRNKYPRFIGEVTMSAQSDIENIEWQDNCTDALTCAKAMRKAAEFLIKRKNDKKRNKG